MTATQATWDGKNVNLDSHTWSNQLGGYPLVVIYYDIVLIIKTGIPLLIIDSYAKVLTCSITGGFKSWVDIKSLNMIHV